MLISPAITTSVMEAESRALATTGPHGVNVVPVSVVTLTDATIQLYDFFMGKTVENLSSVPEVSFVVWKGLMGVQIKALAEYVTSGEVFNSAVVVMKHSFPERTLRGVIVMRPTAVYDVSAGPTAGNPL